MIRNVKKSYCICRDKYSMRRESPFPYLSHCLWKRATFQSEIGNKRWSLWWLTVITYILFLSPLFKHIHTYPYTRTHARTHRSCICYEIESVPYSQRTCCVVCGIDIQEIISRSFRKHLHCWWELSVHWCVARKMTLYLEFHNYQIGRKWGARN